MYVQKGKAKNKTNTKQNKTKQNKKKMLKLKKLAIPRKKNQIYCPINCRELIIKYLPEASLSVLQ